MLVISEIHVVSGDEAGSGLSDSQVHIGLLRNLGECLLGPSRTLQGNLIDRTAHSPVPGE